MSSNKQTLYLFIVYTLLILGVSYWSGKTGTGKTLYDRYKVSLNGAIIPITDYNRSLEFYTSVLNFSPLNPTNKEEHALGVTLSDGHNILFRPVNKSLLEQVITAGGRNNLLIIQVKNGFKKLHQELIKRSKQPPQMVSNESYIQEVKPGSITKIIKQPWGSEFIANDPDGNRILFTNSNRRY